MESEITKCSYAQMPNHIKKKKNKNVQILSCFTNQNSTPFEMIAYRFYIPLRIRDASHCFQKKKQMKNFRIRRLFTGKTIQGIALRLKSKQNQTPDKNTFWYVLCIVLEGSKTNYINRKRIKLILKYSIIWAFRKSFFLYWLTFFSRKHTKSTLAKWNVENIQNFKMIWSIPYEKNMFKEVLIITWYTF